MDAMILNYIRQLNEELLQAHIRMYALEQKKEYVWHSVETNELYAALAKAQGEFKCAVKTKRNAFAKYNYVGIDDLLNAVLPALSKNGLCVMQPPIEFDTPENIFVYTRLAHASGQWIEGRMRVKAIKSSSGQNELQSQGSQITYLKKYILEGLVGISRSEDTDGSEVELEVQYARNPQKEEAQASLIKITNEQHDELKVELKDNQSLAQEILNKLGLTKLSDMPKNIFPSSIKRIREIKQEINK